MPERSAGIAFLALGSVELRNVGGLELRALLVQPKRLALFAYLVLANPPRLHRRDSLLALFWPESSEDDARRSLRQALHFLRQSLGTGVLTNRGGDEVGVVQSTVWCDVREFEKALEGGREDEAMALYRGHLLEGYHVSGVSPDLEHWLEEERSRLRGRAVSAVSALADRAEAAGNLTLAVQRLRELLRIDPGSESALRRLMTLLSRADDRAGAVRAYDDFARRLAMELETKPSAETVALADRLREGPSTPAPPPVVQSTSKSPVQRSVVESVRRDRRWWTRLAAIAALALMTLVVVVLRPRDHSPDTAMILAVGAVEDRTGSDSASSTRVLRDLLATDLARIPGVMIVSHDRMQELLTQVASDESRAAFARAASSAGAVEILEGELYRRPRDSLRLDVRRIGVGTGVIRRAYTAGGRDLFTVVEQFSAQLAEELGQPSPTPSLSDLTTTSLVARRFYDEGLKAFYQTDVSAALRLFRAALTEDSTFAMAAYYAARAADDIEPLSTLGFAAQAVRMSRRATERERLLIAAEWAYLTNNPMLVPVAESLFARFPLEPAAEFELGRALAWSGDFHRAIPHYRRAAERDSLSFVESVGGVRKQLRCTACEAIANLTFAHAAVDSAAAAERAARELVRLRPRSLLSWGVLAHSLDLQGRFAEAMAAYRTRQSIAQQLDPGDPNDDAFLRAQALIRAGDFYSADRLLEDRARDGSLPIRIEATWWQVVSFRNQGRLSEALVIARRHRDLNRNDAASHLPEALVLLEMGRAREAAARFEASAALARTRPLPHGAPDSALGLQARPRAWFLTHVGTAVARSGDTVRLARLVDSVQTFGARSAYGRDRRLHHHLRGLLLVSRGARDDAVSEFRRAIYSPTIGYTRTNIELGRTLVALGRSDEAAAVFGSALRGELEASNLYVTHAELHEELAKALETAGKPDSARPHYAWVANAWRSADPAFRIRAARARAKASSPAPRDKQEPHP